MFKLTLTFRQRSNFTSPFVLFYFQEYVYIVFHMITITLGLDDRLILHHMTLYADYTIRHHGNMIIHLLIAFCTLFIKETARVQIATYR